MVTIFNNSNDNFLEFPSDLIISNYVEIMPNTNSTSSEYFELNNFTDNRYILGFTRPTRFYQSSNGVISSSIFNGTLETKLVLIYSQNIFN